MNLVIYGWFPLLAAPAFHAFTALADAGPHAPLFDRTRRSTTCASSWRSSSRSRSTSSASPAGRACVLRHGSPFLGVLREMVAPVMSAELSSAALTVVAVYVAVHPHRVGLAMVGIVLAIFQYLVAELLTSRRRSAQLRSDSVEAPRSPW